MNGGSTLKRLALPLVLALALAGCTINAPIQTNNQVDQRSGTFSGNTGQTQVGGGSLPIPASGGTHIGSSASGTVASAASQDSPWFVFGPVKTFPDGTVFQVLDEYTLVGVSGTTIYTTIDAGKSWNTYTGVTEFPIKTFHFLDAKWGWVAGIGGGLARISLNGSEFNSAIQDPGSDKNLAAIHFINGSEGFVSDENGLVRRTSDGGETWDEGLAPAGLKDREWSRFLFVRDIDGGVIFNYYLQNWGIDPGSLLRFAEGAFIPVAIDGVKNIGVAATTDGRAYVSEVSAARMTKDGIWFTTTDWQSFKNIETPIKTTRQIIRSKLMSLIPASRSEVLGYLESGEYIWSDNAGESWTGPFKLEKKLQWIKPFSKARAWAWDGNTLYRAGI